MNNKRNDSQNNAQIVNSDRKAQKASQNGRLDILFYSGSILTLSSLKIAFLPSTFRAT